MLDRSNGRAGLEARPCSPSRAGLPFYGIVDVVDGQLEAYSRPGPSGDEPPEVLAPGHVVSVEIDGDEVGRIPVADLPP